MGRYTPRARWGPDQRACQPWDRTREVVSGGVFRGTREDAEGNHDASGVPWQRHTPFVGGDHRANGGAACGQRGARVRPRGGSRVWWAPWIQRPSRVRRPPCVPRDWTILGTVLGSLCLPPGGRGAPCCGLCRTVRAGSCPPPPLYWYYCDNPQGYYPYVQQ